MHFLSLVAAFGATTIIASPVAFVEKRALVTFTEFEMASVSTTVYLGAASATPNVQSILDTDAVKPNPESQSTSEKKITFPDAPNVQFDQDINTISKFETAPEAVDISPDPDFVPAPFSEAFPHTSNTKPHPNSGAAPNVEPTSADDCDENVPTNSNDYQSTAIFHHNIHRANHTAGELTWNSTLAEFALKTARECVFAHDLTQGSGDYGQNIASFGSSSGVKSLEKSNLVADSISNKWYNDEFDFVPFGVESPPITGPQFLHLTQVVWKDTKTLGCATHECSEGTIFPFSSLFTVCNYFPAGNILGQFDTQVSAPRSMDLIKATIF